MVPVPDCGEIDLEEGAFQVGVSVRSQFVDEQSTGLKNNKAKGPEEHRGQTVSLRYKRDNSHFRLESGKEHLNEQWLSPKATHQWPGTGMRKEAGLEDVEDQRLSLLGICHNKCHRLGSLSNRMDCLTVPEATHPRSRFRQV